MGLSVTLGAESTVSPGTELRIESKSPTSASGVVFEDDGTTGYLYGVDHADSQNLIQDAMLIYDVAQLPNRTPAQLQLVWSRDGLKAALLINGHPMAVFDFSERRGYCRTGFPPPMHTGFSKEGHAWDDRALDLFR